MSPSLMEGDTRGFGEVAPFLVDGDSAGGRSHSSFRTGHCAEV